jgi:hypothetical protein
MSINIPTAYKTNIVLPYGGLKATIEWCERNCTDEWRFDASDGTGPAYDFYFESERDYVAFTMWKK